MDHVNDIDDRWPRRLGILAFGLTIPHVAGLFGSVAAPEPRFWLGTAWFVALAWAIWQGNRWLLFRQRERLDWLSRPAGKVATMVAGCVFYTAPVTALALAAWYVAAGLPVDRAAITDVVLLNVICVLFVTHVYETAFLVKARQDDQLKLERLQRTRVEAELEALRSQIDPHFLFNSLSTLRWLIERDPAAAADYTQRLAHVYRYILANRDRQLVQLADELAFVEEWFHLLQVRFGDALRLCSVADEPGLDRLLLPPISLQVLLENAVKHNVFSSGEPMDIEVVLRDGHIEVRNPTRPRPASALEAGGTPESTGVGLRNLAERYRLVLARDIDIDDRDGRFTVRLPLVEVGR